MRTLQIRGRELSVDKPLVMAVLNITPDSFSDGGKYFSGNEASKRAEQIIIEGADILDIGGESTRPGGMQVSADLEIDRVVPVIENIKKRFDIPVSIDTTKSEVAKAAVDVGAEIINDISGLRLDESLADIAAEGRTGLILMHSRGSFERMHSQPPIDDIFPEVAADLHRAIQTARERGVVDEQIVLDVGIGFGKTQAQNLELIAKLDKLKAEFPAFPFLIGASRKSFIGRALGGASSDERLHGSVAAAAVAAWNGADIVRVHDVRETVEALKIVRAIKDQL
jgi:dihydropteroate synthase